MRLGIALAALLLAAGCASLPSLDARSSSTTLADTSGTALARAVAPRIDGNPGKTGVHLLGSGTDAYAARVVVARAAERSIDAQYYIWHPDQSGLFLLDELARAAARGVRVRLLLDDQNTGGMDRLLASLGARPGIEIRLYNPFATRGARVLDYLGGFSRLNRRMHNKAFIADGAVAVIGGRNVANEYFQAGSQVPVVDLDLVAIGGAVPEISKQFDLYWNSASAYPAPTLLAPAHEGADAETEAQLAAAREDPVTKAYVEAVRATPLVTDLLAQRLPLEWAVSRLVYDDPAKTLDTEDRRDILLLSRLLEGSERPQHSVDIVSPYFAPGERGTQALVDLARSGIRVRILTNSLAATDFPVVYSGYSKRRCELARAGVQLFELKPSVVLDPKKRPGSSSAASLHAKTYAVDGERLFVGSFNFDLRSALLNTEMGLVMRSPALAGRLTTAFAEGIPANSYEVRARKDGACVEWIERAPQGEVRHESEPLSSWSRRAWLEILEMLPVDWML